MISHSRANPSPRYRHLVASYRRMHRDGDPANEVPPEMMFDGRSLPPHAGRIKGLIDRYEAEAILDYGAGKGQQYSHVQIELEDGRGYVNLLEYWGIDVVCYDPAYQPFDTLPSQRYDGVVSTDVLEHCPEEDMEWIVEEIFGLARKFVFATVALYPAGKSLPNGENAHVTIRPVDWWRTLIMRIAANHPDVRFQFFLISSPSDAAPDHVLVEG
jgi:hypothetical protein